MISNFYIKGLKQKDFLKKCLHDILTTYRPTTTLRGSKVHFHSDLSGESVAMPASPKCNVETCPRGHGKQLLARHQYPRPSPAKVRSRSSEPHRSTVPLKSPTGCCSITATSPTVPQRREAFVNT